MNGGESTRKPPTLHERMSAFNAAILRINAPLDVTTVLQEVVESARALTDSRYGMVSTMDETGKVQDFVTSGFTVEELGEAWPDGPRLFDHIRKLREPLRLTDLPAFIDSLGYSSDVVRARNVYTYQGTPLLHRGAHIGSFFLGGKEGGAEYSAEDEEVLVLFASQAAAAITNVRTYRNEQRARACLEALVDTSPVGVVVIDVRTGNPVTVNREARRIVEDLRTPGRSLEEDLAAITCQRANGRATALVEFPLARQVSSETVRAEEIVLSVPDGRSVRTLVNSTPIDLEDGEVESVVMTLQDLAALDELERQRAEFLGMVSHELRAPLTSIKGSVATLLESAQEIDPAERHEFFRIIDDQAERMRSLISDLLDAGRIESGTLSVAPEPSEAAALVDRARNTFLSGGGRHTVLIDLPPNLPRVMADRRRIEQVLNNLLANAARHSPESAPIRVGAERDGVHVAVWVADEGQGVAPERLSQLFRKYGQHGDGGRVRTLTDTGLGLVICKGLVEAHGGRIWAESGGIGQGTRVSFSLPVAEQTPAGTEPPGVRGRPADPPPDGRETTRILVVDDDPQTLRYVRNALADAGYEPLVTGDHADLAHIIRTEQPHLVLLDLMLSETDGIELMKSVPEIADLPVVFISGYGRDETIARALESGAVDYIVKPFSATELTARVRSALRRRADPEPFVLGELAIHYEERRVTVGGREVPLTPTEYEIVWLLSRNAGRVTTFHALLRHAWRGKETGNVKLVRNFVKKLRTKLGEDAGTPTWIFTVRGVGYRMRRPPREPHQPPARPEARDRRQ